MANILKNYASTLALLAGVVIGGALGVLAPDFAHSLAPVGDIFLNLIFVLVVPLVLFSVSSSICKLRKGGNVGKVIGWTFVVFLGMSLVAAVVGLFATKAVSPLDIVDKDSVLAGLPPAAASNGLTGDAIVSALTVPDFTLLFSKSNLLPLIIFSALLGAGVSLAGEKGRPFGEFLDSGMEVTVCMLNVIMYAAPVGLGCYFADTIASVGGQLLGGYLRVFLIVCALALLFFFVINPLYIRIIAGRDAYKAFWKHIVPPSLTAVATASSSAAMPGNIDAAVRMGVSPLIADAVVPLGTNIHKDGSVMGGIVKVVFLMILFGQETAGVMPALEAIGVAMLAAVVVGAVASGGCTGEIFTCALMGLDPKMVGVLIIIGTIIDIPCTLINSSSNVVAAVLVDKFAGDGRG